VKCLQTQADLLEMIETLGTRCRLTYTLYGWQQHADENCDDGDYHQHSINVKAPRNRRCGKMQRVTGNTSMDDGCCDVKK